MSKKIALEAAIMVWRLKFGKVQYKGKEALSIFETGYNKTITLDTKRHFTFYYHFK